MKKIQTIEIKKRTHVLCDSYRKGYYLNNGERIPEANYNNTGMALCGIIKEGDTLKDWIDRFGQE